MSPDNERPVFALSRRLGCEWPNLQTADSQACKALNDLIGILGQSVPKFSSEDTSSVVFGSLGEVIELSLIKRRKM